MKIAFLSANREQLPEPVIPLGLLYVMEACPPGHETELWDVCFEEDRHAYVRERVDAFEPDLVAVGIRNLQNADYTDFRSNMGFYTALIETLRASTDAPIVVGGSGFSVLPEGLMGVLRPDYGIAGEGEGVFPLLVERIGSGAPVTDLGGLLHFVDGEQRRNPPAPAFLTLDQVAPPDRSRLDTRYYDFGGVDSLQTKRGCVLKCDYCTYPIIEGARSRVRDPKKVADELEQLIALHPEVQHVFLVDSVFNLPIRHAKEVCREFVRRGNGMAWTCYANPIAFDAELAGLMAEAGCAGVEVGADSGVDAILRRLKKGFDTEAIRRMHRLCGEAGLLDCQTFILGTEGETLDDVARTLDFVEELDAHASIIMSWVDDHEALDDDYADERRQFRDRVNTILAERARDHTRWILPQLGVMFDAKLSRVLHRLGLAGPLWLNIHLAEGDLDRFSSVRA